METYISCKSGNMIVSHGGSTKKLTLCPLVMPSSEFENPLWFEDSDEELTRPLLTLEQDITFKEYIKNDLIYTTITNPHDDCLSPYSQILTTFSRNLFTHLVGTIVRFHDLIIYL